ncbi:MAG: hypothetical protein U0L10_16660, partial [Lachnospiraceae bacterium]|nr:hypothetical protein [Lachnospiraceae bacterium]
NFISASYFNIRFIILYFNVYFIITLITFIYPLYLISGHRNSCISLLRTARARTLEGKKNLAVLLYSEVCDSAIERPGRQYVTDDFSAGPHAP